jgi:hypothetical protein
VADVPVEVVFLVGDARDPMAAMAWLALRFASISFRSAAVLGLAGLVRW